MDNAITPKKPDLLVSNRGGIRRLGWCFSFFFRYAQNYIMQVIGQGVMYDLRYQIFSHLQHQSLSYFDRNPVGRLISRLTNDVDALNEFIGIGPRHSRGRPGGAGGRGGRDVRQLDWRLALVSLAVLPLIAVASWAFQHGCAPPTASSA